MKSLISIKNSFIIAPTIILILFACKSKQPRADTIASNEVYPNDRELKIKVLNGDTVAYYQLYSKYYERDNPLDFIPWALIMANKYGYKRAYRDLFECLQSADVYYGKYDTITKRHSKVLDSITVAFSINYLKQYDDTDYIGKSLREIDLKH